MYKNPIEDFNNIKKDMYDIVRLEDKNLLFYELSRSISATEEFILKGDIDNEDFLEVLSQLIVDTLSLFCSIYGVEDSYEFIQSRSHLGDFNGEEDFKDTYNCLVKPFYELRVGVSKFMLKEQKGFRIAPLFALAKFEKYLEEVQSKSNWKGRSRSVGNPDKII